jgi:ABC-2 type transport system permease protein
MLVAQPTALSLDHGVRLAVWAAIHLIYLLVVAALVLTVSASARSSRGALVTLLAAWVVMVLLLPKAAANLGVAAAALPSRAEFEASMRRDLAEGIDGHNPDRERREAIEREALARYGVSRMEDLPVNIDGLLLEAGEAYSTLVYERHITALRAAIERQNQLTDRLTLINPYAAVRTLSISVAGTDYADHTAFQDAVENYRRTLVTAMNHWITVNTTPGARRASAPVTLWSTVPPFTYSGLDCLDALRFRPTAVAGLVVAVAAAAAGLAAGARRMRVV